MDIRLERDLAIEAYLKQLAPTLPWSVKNQARMHLKNHDNAYSSCENAMSHWPEIETAVGVNYSSDLAEESGDPAQFLQIVSPFGLSSLFALQLTANPCRELGVFERRVETKGWLKNYPRLQLGRSPYLG